ncbi:MAG: preprotein translocase subunit YajC [candidate division Zixibacteria bacterium]|nr:preprotein translocase subunit YajC [candidate division Zixibacteria bacterium]
MLGIAFAMAGSQGGEGGGNIFLSFLPFILMFVILYFLLIRPQTKKQKEHQKMLSELRKGDRVVTNSGIFGTIVGINEKDNVVVLKIAENVKVEVLRSSIGGRVQE